MANYYASLPYEYLKLLELPPRYSLVLAPDVVTYPDFYYDVYRNFRAKAPIYGSIVDSGVVERLHYTDEMLVEACNIIKPRALVLPDVYKDASATIDRIDRFITLYGSAESVRNTRLMGVVQGNTPLAIRDCLSKLLKMPIHIIGIPYRLADIMHRLGIAILVKMFSNKEVHYLGMDNILEDMNDCRMYERYVNSIDSAVPVTMGFNRLSIGPNTINIPTIIRERKLIASPDKFYALDNINAVAHWCQRMEVPHA